MNFAASSVTNEAVLVSFIAGGIGAFLCVMIALSFYFSWKRTGYKLILALTIFFGTLAITRTISTLTAFAYLIDNHRILIVPFFQYREILFTAALAYLFYTLWYKNNKVRKAIEVAQGTQV